MKTQEAKILLGFAPHSFPSQSQVKDAYRKKVWETHPDRFVDQEKSSAECKFKLVSEAYSCLQSGGRREVIHSGRCQGSYYRVVRTGTPRVNGSGLSRANQKLIGLQLLVFTLGTLTLGGLKIAKAYKKEQEIYPSHNPFLP